MKLVRETQSTAVRLEEDMGCLNAAFPSPQDPLSLIANAQHSMIYLIFQSLIAIATPLKLCIIESSSPVPCAGVCTMVLLKSLLTLVANNLCHPSGPTALTVLNPVALQSILPASSALVFKVLL